MLISPARLAPLLLAAATIAAPAGAQPVDSADKEVRLIVGFGAGSGYDAYGRLIARA
jgi:tripartite-type tricarboxylate transporter receptor subunit TctC